MACLAMVCVVRRGRWRLGGSHEVAPSQTSIFFRETVRWRPVKGQAPISVNLAAGVAVKQRGEFLFFYFSASIFLPDFRRLDQQAFCELDYEVMRNAFQSTLRTIQWVNLERHHVEFVTLTR
jgi:hypothetical protein